MELFPDEVKMLLKWFAQTQPDVYKANTKTEAQTKPRKMKFVLAGLAGTGKSTLIAEFLRNFLIKQPELKVAVVAYTGKAALELQQKLNTYFKPYPNLLKLVFSGTIHSLIYSAVKNNVGEIVGWEKKSSLPHKIIIVDEASMLNNQLWEDINSYGIPILLVGDNGQLPPIERLKNDFSITSLLEKPDILLNKIHRQQENSQILTLAAKVRNTGDIEGQITSDGSAGNVRIIHRHSDDAASEIGDILESYSKETMIVAGFNATRVRLNKHIRGMLEYSPEGPVVNDKVICLKNNHKLQIYNGMVGFVREVESIDEEFSRLFIDFPDYNRYFDGVVPLSMFNNKTGMLDGKLARQMQVMSKEVAVGIFDYGYCLTAHKAQGGQARRVIVFAERSKYMDEELWKRWLYTAITRAQEELVVII